MISQFDSGDRIAPRVHYAFSLPLHRLTGKGRSSEQRESSKRLEIQASNMGTKMNSAHSREHCRVARVGTGTASDES